MSRERKLWKYQVLDQWSLNEIEKDDDLSYDTEEKALEKAKATAAMGTRSPIYVCKILYKVCPDVKQVPVKVSEV